MKKPRLWGTWLGFGNWVRDRGRSYLFLVELGGEEFFEGVEAIGGVVAVGEGFDLRTFAGCEHHEPHDRLSIHLLVVFFEEDVRVEFVGNSYNHGGGASVDTHLVLNYEYSFECVAV